MPERRRHPGFTLIELILVLVIIGLLLGIVAPSLGRLRASTRVDDTARQLRSLIELARSRAAEDGRPTRIVIDTQQHECWIEHLEGGGFIRPLESYGKKIALDTQVKIESQDAQGDADALLVIRAEPDGRAQIAQLTLLGRHAKHNRIVFTRSATEPYRIGDADDAAPYAAGGAHAP